MYWLLADLSTKISVCICVKTRIARKRW